MHKWTYHNSTYAECWEWVDLIASGIPVHFLDRQVLFHQGDAGQHVYVPRSGTVKVVRGEVDGGHAILTVRSTGDVLGDFAALDRGARSATVIALGRVAAQMVTADQFRAFAIRPSVAPGFALYTVERLREADVQRGEIALLPVRVRLARTLLRLNDGAIVRMAQHDIARYLGASILCLPAIPLWVEHGASVLRAYDPGAEVAVALNPALIVFGTLMAELSRVYGPGKDG